jgi:integrase
MPVRRLKNGRYVVELQQSGQRIYRRLHPTATRADGLALEAKVRRDIFTTAKLGIKPEVPLSAAIQLWLESVAVHQKDAHRAKLRSKAWAKFEEGRTLRDAPEVAQQALSEWSRPLATVASGNLPQPAGGKSAKLTAPGTINRRLALLKAVCKWSYQQGMIEQNLSGRIRMLREGPGREVYLTPTQIVHLASKAPTSVSKAAIMLLAYTGLRVAELLSLTKTAGTTVIVRAEHSKTGKPRSVPVAGPGRPFLRALPLGLSYWQLHSEFLVARKAAKLPHVRPHDLRHSFASMYLKANPGDLHGLSLLLGHASITTTMRYSHLSPQTLRSRVARLG